MYFLLNMFHQLKSKIYIYIYFFFVKIFYFRGLASTMRALSSAQQPIIEETNNDWTENDDPLAVGGDRYQIVNSYLPINGDYQISKRRFYF